MEETDKIILSLLDELMRCGKVRYQQEFAIAAGMQKQQLISIRSRGRHFTIEHIKNICKEYNINANYILGLSNKKYL